MSTAFALAGLGGNNAHGAGFLAAAQELQRRRQESFTPDALVRLAGLDDVGARRRMDRGILPELEFVSCTSGAIASVLAYLEGKTSERRPRLPSLHSSGRPGFLAMPIRTRGGRFW
jgi:hypothetical protein